MVGQTGSLPGFPERPHRRSQGNLPVCPIFVLSGRRNATYRTHRKIPGYASLPACSIGERPIDRNQSPPNLRRRLPRSGSYKFVFLRYCTLEAMRTQGAFYCQSIEGVRHRGLIDRTDDRSVFIPRRSGSPMCGSKLGPVKLRASPGRARPTRSSPTSLA